MHDHDTYAAPLDSGFCFLFHPLCFIILDKLVRNCPPPPFRSCFRYSEEQVVRRIHIKSALIFSRYTSAKPKKDFMKKDLTYNNLLKILEKLRKLRKSCNHKRNITRILDFGVSTIIVLSSRSFQ